ncbi:MAG: hypothetical protein LKK55_04960, partial [Olsenella sp.]|nr:hypothetical protein [Olsenella sp.]MCI2187735.1 hypothetical protein [Olsenella sp.]
EVRLISPAKLRSTVTDTISVRGDHHPSRHIVRFFIDARKKDGDPATNAGPPSYNFFLFQGSAAHRKGTSIETNP